MSELKTLTIKNFVDRIKDDYEGKERFCFILGAGASYGSIKTGLDLMRDWQSQLLEKSKSDIKNRAEIFGFSWKECERILNARGNDVKSEDYFTLYDLRFGESAIAGYNYLEKEMNGKLPNIGYYYLASILENTDIKLVITTNFDSLTEDAMLYTYGHHPLVLGHESLGSYIEQMRRKPVVAKIHRDLLMNPLNRKKEMQKLQDGWLEPLKAVLSQYIPIVVGYAGGDRTLMSLLKELNLKGIFWCELKNKELSEEAKEIVQKNNGYRVDIDGFNELMYMMVQALSVKHPSGDELMEFSKNRCEDYENKRKKLRESIERVTLQISSDDKTIFLPDIELLKAVCSEQESDTKEKQYNELYIRAVQMLINDWQDEAISLCTDAIKLNPNNAKAYNLRCKIYFLQGKKQEAFEDANRVVEIEPNDADYLNCRGVTLSELGRYEAALKDKNKAIELEPNNAEFYDSRGATLHEFGQYEAALKDKNKAIELEPNNAEFYNSRGATLYKLGQYEEALKDDNKAIELEPNNAEFYNSRGATLHKFGQYEEALKDNNKAIELEPNNARFYNNRGITFNNMERYDEALQDKNKAIELDSTNAKYYDSRGATFNNMIQYKEALQNFNKAIEFAPNNAEYYIHRSYAYDALGRRQQAIMDRVKAKRLSNK